MTETFDATGLPEVSQLDVSFEINDTTSPCSGGAATYPLSWDVSVNGVVVGSFGYVGGQTMFNVPFDESYSFAPVAGTGAAGDSYTITFTSNDPVCPGGGFWGWVSGGEATLHEY